MKKLIVAFSFALSLPAFGQEHHLADTLERIATPAGAPATISEAVEHSKAIRAARAAHIEVVTVDDYEASFLIPAAGSVAGNFGTYFRSDLAISNTRSTDQVVGIGFMRAGIDSTHEPIQYFNIPANTTSAQTDVVATALGKTGLGALVVFAETSALALDSSGQLNGFSRIWTNQPNASGTVSQSFPAIALQDSLGSLTARIIGCRADNQFRTNIGIVNLDSVSHTWTIRAIATGTTFTITVPPYTMNQAGVPANVGSSVGNAAFSLTSDGFGFWWSAYASSVDNITGDGWVSRAIQN